MTRRLVTFIILVLLSAGFEAACDSRNSAGPEDESPYLIEHIDRGCSSGGEAFASSLSGAYLTGYTVVGDTLSLDIHFQANCCPGFTEDVVFGPASVTIDVGDTLYACRCICDYDNTFRILWPDSGSLALHFVSRRYGSPTAICSFDTLIVVPAHVVNRYL